MWVRYQPQIRHEFQRRCACWDLLAADIHRGSAGSSLLVRIQLGTRSVLEKPLMGGCHSMQCVPVLRYETGGIPIWMLGMASSSGSLQIIIRWITVSQGS